MGVVALRRAVEAIESRNHGLQYANQLLCLAGECHVRSVAETLWLTAGASPALELKKAVWLLFIITRVARVGRAARTSSHAAGYAF